MQKAQSCLCRRHVLQEKAVGSVRTKQEQSFVLHILCFLRRTRFPRAFTVAGVSRTEQLCLLIRSPCKAGQHGSVLLSHNMNSKVIY